MPEPTDHVARSLNGAHDGSREALGQALESCRAYLLLIANRELDAGLQAKGAPSDLVQDTFLEAQRDFGGFQGRSAEELKAWLRQILLNNVANFARRYRDTDKRRVGREIAIDAETPSGRLQPGIADDTPSPSRQAMAREQVAELSGALARLPDEYRQIITWRYQEGRSFEEIAKRLDRSENAARKLWYRAIERLEEELGRTL